MVLVAPSDVMALDPIQSDDVVRLYIACLCPRSDIYVENGAGVKREPITPDVIRKAAKHKYPISAYLAYTDDGGVQRTWISAFDFDSEDGLDRAESVQRLLLTFGIECVGFFSRRGAHLWMMWKADPSGNPPKAAIIQRAMKNALGLSGLDPADPHNEVFPHRGEDLAVGALRLPGMHHQKTQVQYPGWTINGEKVEGMLDILSAFIPASYDSLMRLAGPEPEATSYPKRSNPADSFFFARPKTFDDAPSASAVLAAHGVENAKPGGTYRCIAHADRHRSLTVFKDDQRVYCGSPSCPLHGDGHGVGSIVLSTMTF